MDHQEGQGLVEHPHQHQEDHHSHHILLIAQDGVVDSVGQQGEQDFGAVQGRQGDQVEQPHPHPQQGHVGQEAQHEHRRRAQRGQMEHGGADSHRRQGGEEVGRRSG